MADSKEHSDGDLGRIPELVASQKQLCGVLLAAAESQSRCIQEEDPEALLGVLSSRGAHIDQLGDQLKQFNGLLGRELSTEQRQILRTAVDEIRQVVANLIEQDEQGRRRLEACRDGIKGELEKLNRGRSAARSYQSAYSSPAPQGQWADRKV